jgi:glycosyltransferase involved in cell wall biosynthesis
MRFFCTNAVTEVSLLSSTNPHVGSQLTASLKDYRQERRVTIIADPLLSDHGPTRPVALLIETLEKIGYKIRIITPKVSHSWAMKMKNSNVDVINLNFRYFLRGESSVLFETWIREAFLGRKPRVISNSTERLLNFSSTLCVASHVWYVQGPVLVTVTFDSIYNEMPWHYKVSYKFSRPLLNYLDSKFVNNTANVSRKMYANSKYTATLFRSLGFEVAGVIFPPIDTQKFRSSTKTPSEDYVLTYFGKETKYSAVKKVADAGVKIRAFGSKITPLSEDILTHPNIEFLGAIDDNRLVTLYSNALITLFPFTNEPFGYIPVESMACGTPVLSFNWQGPAETIVNGKTGWLVNNDRELIKLTRRLWKSKYDSSMRVLCAEHAKKNFDKKIFIAKFLRVLQNVEQME